MDNTTIQLIVDDTEITKDHILAADRIPEDEAGMYTVDGYLLPTQVVEYYG